MKKAAVEKLITQFETLGVEQTALVQFIENKKARDGSRFSLSGRVGPHNEPFIDVSSRIMAIASLGQKIRPDDVVFLSPYNEIDNIAKVVQSIIENLKTVRGLLGGDFASIKDKNEYVCTHVNGGVLDFRPNFLDLYNNEERLLAFSAVLQRYKRKNGDKSLTTQFAILSDFARNISVAADTAKSAAKEADESLKKITDLYQPARKMTRRGLYDRSEC